jgi:hypothetical protein
LRLHVRSACYILDLLDLRTRQAQAHNRVRHTCISAYTLIQRIDIRCVCWIRIDVLDWIRCLRLDYNRCVSCICLLDWIIDVCATVARSFTCRIRAPLHTL